MKVKFKNLCGGAHKYYFVYIVVICTQILNVNMLISSCTVESINYAALGFCFYLFIYLFFNFIVQFNHQSGY